MKLTLSILAATLLMWAGSTSSLAAQSHTFAAFDPGTVTSNTSGVTTALTTAPASGEYLVYQVSADYVGTGNAAWSFSMQLELSSGGQMLLPLTDVDAGDRQDASATTLRWSGVLVDRYDGNQALDVRFFDSYHDGSGPYTSNVTNVVVKVYEATVRNEFATYSTTTNSGNLGSTTTLPTGSLSSNYFIYTVSADFAGTGNAAFFGEIQLELNDGAGKVFVPLTDARIGGADNTNATTLLWSGVLAQEYVGGDALRTRFFSKYNDAS